MRVSRLGSLEISLIALVAFIVACGSAPGAASTKPAAAPGPMAKPAQVTPERIAAGKALYDKGVCITCHGPGGAGSTNAPPLNDRQWLRGTGTFTQIFQNIVSGFNAQDIRDDGYTRPMPARGENSKGARVLLTDDQITSVAAYVWSISHDM